MSLHLTGAKSGVPPFASDYFQLDDVHYKILDHDDVMGPTIAGTRSRTMYFWTSFQVADPTCYSNLTIGVKAQDGYAIYINNVQALIFGFNATTTQLQYNTQVRVCQQVLPLEACSLRRHLACCESKSVSRCVEFN
jgi:hypothetical protein